jgi:acyl carrier protein
MDHRPVIREFLKNLLTRKGDTQPFSDATSVLASGRLQSIDAVEIVVFLESRVGVDFAKIGFDEEKIDSVDAIALLVEESMQAP